MKNSKSNKLAIHGGIPVRAKEFKSLPYLDKDVINNVVKLLEKKQLSKFVGSPVNGRKKLLSMSSKQALNCQDFVTFLGGPRVRRFEYEWSRIHKVKYSVSVNSATSGLLLAILSLGIKSGDEIICTPFSFTATSAAIVQANAVPIFSDIDLSSFNLDETQIENKITKKTKAVMVVHWNGNAGAIKKIKKICKKYNLNLIEDASQSPGLKYKNKMLGTFGDVGVFSLNEPKNVMTGEGGVVVTDNKLVATRARLIRNHGEAIVDDEYPEEIKNCVVGYNFRLTEIMAEIGIQQARALQKLNRIRKQNYHYLINKLNKICGEFLSPQEISNFDDYAPYHVGFRWNGVKSKIHRDLIIDVLRKEGIPVSQGMPRLMSENVLFKKKYFQEIIGKKIDYKIDELKNAHKLFDHEYMGFTQIGWPNKKKDMDDIILAFKKIMLNIKSLQKEKYTKKETFVSGR